jgi:hypothetical protein
VRGRVGVVPTGLVTPEGVQAEAATVRSERGIAVTIWRRIERPRPRVRSEGILVRDGWGEV